MDPIAFVKQHAFYIRWSMRLSSLGAIVTSSLLGLYLHNHLFYLGLISLIPLSLSFLSIISGEKVKNNRITDAQIISLLKLKKSLTIEQLSVATNTKPELAEKRLKSLVENGLLAVTSSETGLIFMNRTLFIENGPK